MEPDLGQPGGLRERVELLSHIGVVERRSVPEREHEPGGQEAGRDLTLTVLSEDRDNSVGDRDGAAAAPRLDLDPLRHSAG